MAKCIKIISNGFPIRVPDDVAQEMVSSGRAEYINREEWKAGGRVTKVPKTHRQEHARGISRS
jgi:hypothetical protein